MSDKDKEGSPRADAESERRREILQLPGVLAISLYLLVLAGVLILGVAGGHYPVLFLLLAAAFLTASAGLILLLRWAWAGALGAVFVQGLLNLVFFLYLVRAEVRAKLR